MTAAPRTVDPSSRAGVPQVAPLRLRLALGAWALVGLSPWAAAQELSEPEDEPSEASGEEASDEEAEDVEGGEAEGPVLDASLLGEIPAGQEVLDAAQTAPIEHEASVPRFDGAPEEAAPARTAAAPDAEAARQAACRIWDKPGEDVRRSCYHLGKGFTLESEGNHRLIGTVYPDLDVDARGTSVGQAPALDHRLRLALGFGFKTLRVQTEWDLLTGQIAGDTWDIPGEEDDRRRWTKDAATLAGQVPRRASLSAVIPDAAGGPVPIAILEAGLLPATWWGLGILANGGERDTLFGRVDGGDRMLRSRLTMAPVHSDGQRIPLFFTLGFDMVVEDDTALWREGERGYHVISSILYRAPKHQLGLFYTFRTQTEPTDAPRPTNAHVLDLFGQIDLDFGDSGWGLSLATEDVLITGNTQRALTYGDPELTRIRSGAVVGHATLTTPGDFVDLELRGGWTSATGDPDAGTLEDFTADRNYNVGVVLFDEVMGGIEAGTYALLQDPALTGGPPDGADGLVTEGSVRRAAWVWPSLHVRPWSVLDLRVGYLAAWSTGPIAQAFYTARNGGTPTNHLDQETDGRFMGHEVQWQLGAGRTATTSRWRYRPQLFLEGGHAFLSPNLGGGVASLYRVTAQVNW